jgi:hypothetical protein
MEKRKKLDLIILLIYPIIGAIGSHLLNINAFGSVMVFFGLPSLYLTIRAIKYAKRSIIFSIISSVPLIIIIDYIAHLTDQWIIPNSILPRIFQYITVEVIVWAILNCYFVIMFYEYFLHHHFTKKLWSNKLRYLFIFGLFLFVLFLFAYNFAPAYLHIPFFYLWFGLILILIPIILQLFTHPKFVSKFFETAAYFFYLTLTYEITALQLGWWDFPGEKFIGWISFFNIRFPVEELVFWLLLFAMCILTFYEYFDDEEK